jgi:hypothetical protein
MNDTAVGLNKRCLYINKFNIIRCLCSTFRCQHRFNATCDSTAQLPSRTVELRCHFCLPIVVLVFHIYFCIKRAPLPIPITEIRCRAHRMQCICSTMLTCPFNGLGDGAGLVLGAWSFALIVVTMIRAAAMIWERLGVTGKLVKSVGTTALLHIK